MQVYTFPKLRVKFLSFLLGIPVAAFLLFIWLSPIYSFSGKFSVSLIVLAPSLFVILLLTSSRVAVDEHAITTRGLFIKTMIPWSKIDDLVCTEEFTVIKSSALGLNFKVLHPLPDNPLQRVSALENHMELRNEILKRSLPYLEKVWKNGKDRVYKYPRLSLLRHILYLAPVWPIIFAIIFWSTYYQKFKLDFVLFGIYISVIPGVFSSFLYFKSRHFFGQKKILLKKLGLLFEFPRKKIEVQWDELKEISIPKPDSFSKLVNLLGFAVLYTRSGEQIIVPLPMERFCDFLFQVRTHTSLKVEIPIPGLGPYVLAKEPP